ncbi:hypothetical protein R1flu_003410 [Riccia fluitans]|uniref:Uncharacterized protein n=1 Tax=Riccia fluitans TaxID=41844 RepID=A0ABD1Y8Z7_9MARC
MVLAFWQPSALTEADKQNEASGGTGANGLVQHQRLGSLVVEVQEKSFGFGRCDPTNPRLPSADLPEVKS